MATKQVPTRTPVLDRVDDIFLKFNMLVTLNKRTGLISWHKMNISNESKRRDVPFDTVKAELREKLFKALRASPLWTVRIIDTRDDAAQITLREAPATRRNKAPSPPKASAAAATRRNKAPSPPKASAAVTRRNKTPSPPKASAATAASAAAAAATLAPFHCNSSSSAMAEAREAVVEAVATAVGGAGARPGGKPKTAAQVMKSLLNKLTDKNFESIRDQILLLAPANNAEYETMIESLQDALLDNRAYHPQFIEMLRRMAVRHTTHPYPSPPCAALNDCLLGTFAKGPEGVQIAVDMEEGKLNNKNDTLDTLKKRKTLRYESLTLLLGYLLREEMLPLDDFVKAFRSLTVDEEDDYRLQDVVVQSMLFMLVRAGPRLSVMPEAHEFLRAALGTVQTIADSYPRGAFRGLAKDLLACKERGWILGKVEGSAPKWTVGAPKDGVVVRTLVKALAPEGLGADQGELYRRFPVVVKEVGRGVYAVEVHGMKLRERCEKTGKTEKQVLDPLFALVHNSQHFERIADPRDPPRNFLMLIRRK